MVKKRELSSKENVIKRETNLEHLGSDDDGLSGDVALGN